VSASEEKQKLSKYKREIIIFEADNDDLVM